MEDTLSNEISNNAADFSASLRKLAIAIDGDISKVIRNGVLRVFGNIVRRSPVDTGAYRGSHGVANFEPDDTQGAIKAAKGGTYPPADAKGWMWQVGAGDIWIYNNVPYARRIEEGWSKQAPAGVYRLALVELTIFLNNELIKYSSLGPYGEGE